MLCPNKKGMLLTTPRPYPACNTPHPPRRRDPRQRPATPMACCTCCLALNLVSWHHKGSVTVRKMTRRMPSCPKTSTPSSFPPAATRSCAVVVPMAVVRALRHNGKTAGHNRARHNVCRFAASTEHATAPQTLMPFGHALHLCAYATTPRSLCSRVTQSGWDERSLGTTSARLHAAILEGLRAPSRWKPGDADMDGLLKRSM